MMGLLMLGATGSNIGMYLHSSMMRGVHSKP